MKKGKRLQEEEESYKYTGRCRRHPWMRSAGVCPRCLAERLEKLFCPDCHEQKIFSDDSCSCSEATSSSLSSRADSREKKPTPTTNANGAVEIGSVGRISALIDSDRPSRKELETAMAVKTDLLRRSRSVAYTGSSITLEIENPKCPAEKTKKSHGMFGFLKKKKKSNNIDSSVGSHSVTEGRLSTGVSPMPRNSAFSPMPRNSAFSPMPRNSGFSPSPGATRFLKSRSMADGRRSFSGFFGAENKGFMSGRHSNVCPTPSHDGFGFGQVRGSIPQHCADSEACSRVRSWGWAFRSPLRVFMHSSKYNKPHIAHPHAASVESSAAR